jgi:antitoxin YefM
MTTETISYTSLRQNLSSVLSRIETNKETYLVTRKKHADIVMIARDDYDSLVETLHLLSNTVNSSRLNESLQQDINGEYKKVKI